MPLPVNLLEVVDYLDMQSDMMGSYINRKTGELVSLSDEERLMLETSDAMDTIPEWQAEAIALAKRVLDSDDCVELPDRFEIQEYSLMEAFCEEVVSDEVGLRLADAIGGRGAFRRFKDAIRREGVADQWFALRASALRRIAIDFLEAEGIPYQESNSSPGEAKPASV